MVASDVGGLSENIENFKNGVKVYPSSDSVAWGINYIIDDPLGVKKLGAEGYKEVKKKFSWDRIGKKTIESYEKSL